LGMSPRNCHKRPNTAAHLGFHTKTFLRRKPGGRTARQIGTLPDALFFDDRRLVRMKMIYAKGLEEGTPALSE